MPGWQPRGHDWGEVDEGRSGRVEDRIGMQLCPPLSLSVCLTQVCDRVLTRLWHFITLSSQRRRRRWVSPPPPPPPHSFLFGILPYKETCTQEQFSPLLLPPTSTPQQSVIKNLVPSLAVYMAIFRIIVFLLNYMIMIVILKILKRYKLLHSGLIYELLCS